MGGISGSFRAENLHAVVGGTASRLSVSHQGSRFNITPRRDSHSLPPSLSLTSPGLNHRRPSSENPPSSSRLCAFGPRKGSLQRPGVSLGSALQCLQCAIGPCYGRSPRRAEAWRTWSRSSRQGSCSAAAVSTLPFSFGGLRINPEIARNFSLLRFETKPFLY